MAAPTSPPATSLPLTIKYPAFTSATPQEVQDAINYLYKVVALHANNIEVLRNAVNTNASST
jgi:hypothetical protein